MIFRFDVEHTKCLLSSLCIDFIRTRTVPTFIICFYFANFVESILFFGIVFNKFASDYFVSAFCFFPPINLSTNADL